LETLIVTTDSLDIDGLPFLEALRRSAENRWSGILRAAKGDEEIGSVFMRDGSIAWAVSKYQKENFAHFLERIGLIPRDKLNEAVKRYKALGKARKLGELLEEEGLISSDKLKECLGAHIQAALKSLMDDSQLVMEASHGEMAVDANLVFELPQLLPAEGEIERDAGSSGNEAVYSEHPNENAEDSLINDILGNLASLPGYRFSFVSDRDGKRLALHRADTEPDPGNEISWVAEWINITVRHCSGEEFGRMDAIILEHERGMLVAQSVEDIWGAFVAVAFGKEGKLGVIKHKLGEITSSIRQHMDRSAG
jgi:hypothetical protein